MGGDPHEGRAMGWHVIETLIPETSTVVWSRGERVEFGSVLRLGRRLGVDVAALVEDCRAAAEGIDTTVDGTDGRAIRVITVPCIGRDDVVHAVSVWAGRADHEVTERPVLGAIAVDFETMRVWESLDDYLMHSLSAEGYSPYRDIGMFMDKVLGFPKAAELVEMVTNPEARDRYTGTLILKHDNGNLMSWYGVARIDYSIPTLRGFAQDVTASEGVTLSTPEMARVSLGQTATRSSAVLIGFPVDEKAPPVLSYWLTAAPRSLENSDITASWEFDAPSAAQLWRTTAQLHEPGAPSTVPITVRMRAPRREWVNCRLTCSKYPSADVGPGIMLAELTLL